MDINKPNSLHSYAYDDRGVHTPSSNTGENPVEGISVVPPNAVQARCSSQPSLQDMPDELLRNIFSRLSCSEKVVVKSTFKAADRVVNDLLYRESIRWFSRFSPLQQAKFKKIAEGTDEQVLRTWLGQFTEEEKVVKHLIDNRYHRHYPELFFYTVSRLMADCQAFKVEQVVSIEQARCVVKTTFSDDGNHMVTQSFNGQSRICSLSPGGKWMEKTIICDNRSCFSWVRFSGDSKHVKIRYCSSPSKIYALNSDGNWLEEHNLPKGRNIKFTEFSPDGLHVAIIDKTNTLSFFGQGMDGAWTEEKKGELSDRVYLDPPIFSRDSNELVAVSTNEELLIYRRGSDGCWTEKAILASIKANSCVFQASPNDNHMVTQHLHAKNAKIFGRGTDGNWMEKAVIDHKARSVDFSPNSRYLVINCYNTAAIYYLDMNGSWIKKATIDSTSIPSTAAVSFDGRFLVIPANDGTVKLYGLGADGQCTETSRINRATDAFFSNDGNHIFTYYRKWTVDDNLEIPDGNLRLYGLSQDGKLKLKATIDHGQRIHSATISPTGRYLVTNGYDAKAKIWILCSSAENEPGSRQAVRE